MVPAAHSAGAGPLQALDSYWSAINDGDYATAYGWLAPGVADSEADFVAGERSSEVKSASFSGHVVSDNGSAATVGIDSLQTHEHADGCTNWSGSYDLSQDGGRWLMEGRDRAHDLSLSHQWASRERCTRNGGLG